MVGLIALGATNPEIQFAGRLVARYGLPILVMSVLSHVGKLGFIVYPSRYLPKDL